MKKVFCFFTVAFICASLFGQVYARPWWYSLELGKNCFRSGDYGGALLAFEDARRARREMYERMERDFINFLSLSEVRRLGDSLDWVERYAYERHFTAAAAALEELYYRVPKASLNNSATSALKAIGSLKGYPEAEYWIGETYRVEGEFTLALGQYRKALAMRELLDSQDFYIDLQYKIADILRTRQEYNEFERTLLSIIADHDTLWTDAINAELRRHETLPERGSVPYNLASASFALQAMTRTMENEGPNRFLSLYRYDNTRTEPAHRSLGFFYAVSGRPSAQQHLTFAFLIQNTVIISECIRRNFEFTFTTLEDLSREIAGSPVILSYLKETEYYKTAFYLAASLYRNGKTEAARVLWTFLSRESRAGEWQSRSIQQLRSPHLEPIVEMP